MISTDSNDRRKFYLVGSDDPNVDRIQYEGRFEFDSSVATVFDDMLRRSIPDYETMRALVFEIGSRFVEDRTSIVDLGTSRGDALSGFVDRFGARNHFVGIDTSEPMIDAARERFAGYIEAGIVRIERVDLRTDFPVARYPASLFLSVLTLQFVPIEYRLRILADIYSNLRSGGALVLVEKVIGADAEVDRMLVDLYHEFKRANGYPDEAIRRKALSLEGVLVPLTADFNEAMIRKTGFRRVDLFWRCLNFAAWVAVK